MIGPRMIRDSEGLRISVEFFLDMVSKSICKRTSVLEKVSNRIAISYHIERKEGVMRWSEYILVD